MSRQFLLVLGTTFVGLLILFVSIARSAQIRYSFRISQNETSPVLGVDTDIINYKLPYPGRVLPDNPLWYAKVARDKLWLAVSTKPERKSELNQLFADKRLVSSKLLFEKGKGDLAYSTLTKSEKYLEKSFQEEEKARKNGVDTEDILDNLALDSLKHLEILEQIMSIAPEQVKPQVVVVKDSVTSLYNRISVAIFETGNKPPENPFIKE